MDTIVIKRPRSFAPSRWAVIPVLFGAFFLRLWHLGARSIWTDEGSTWIASSAPLAELIRLCAQKDASPPLYYMLTSLSLRFGDGEAALRMISVLASVGLVWLTYRFARLFVGRPEATLAALLITVAPFQIMYAQEARTYALVALFSVWSLYLFVRAAVFGHSKIWWPYIAVSALGMYTQSIFLLSIGVQTAIVALHPEARRRMLFWLFALAAVILLYLPWLFVSMAQMGRLGDSHWYLETPGGQDIFRVLRTLFLSPIPLVVPSAVSNLPGLGAAMPAQLARVLLLLVFGIPFLAALRNAIASPPRAWRASARGAGDSLRRAEMTRIALAAFALPLLAVLIVSIRTPLWLPRYFVFLSPFLAVLLAAGMAVLRPRPLGVVFAALALLVLLYGTQRYDIEYTKEPWRDAMRTITAGASRDSSAVLVPFDIAPLRFYNLKRTDPLPAFEVSHPDVPFSTEFTAQQLDEVELEAANHIEGYADVWVVLRDVSSEVRRDIARRSLAVAAAGRDSLGRWRFDSTSGPVTVVRYRRAGT